MSRCLEVFVMPQVSRLGSFSIRSSGRDLSVVRRPVARVVVAPVAVPDVASLKKAELVELAEARGVDASGTKADIVDRLGPESNDATVRVDG